ncbi:MAG: type II toxin-antitoxin system Phd/YefM family antitoxin [Coriobacteriia bacterium]|nr:type II toxin-antitoxin system Phd/YefM family antitoxin [Coriobacteriia bacterium]
MTRVSVADARREFADILNRAAYSHERTVITRHEADVAAVISIEELCLLDALIERYEDEADIEDARSALLEAREDRVGWEAVKREFGL